MFSVIIAAYNAEKFIRETLKSLVLQTYEDWECIVVVNGSTDKTINIVNDFTVGDNRFNVLNLPFANKSAALNEGIINSNKSWISILDADDLWTSEKLMSQASFINLHKEFDVLGTQMQYIDAFGKLLENSPSLPCDHVDIIKSFDACNNAIANSSVVYKNNLHLRFGYYDVETFAVEDYDWWKRLARLGARFSNLKDTHVYHRIHKSSNFNSSNRQAVHKMLVDAVDGRLRTMKTNIS